MDEALTRAAQFQVQVKAAEEARRVACEARDASIREAADNGARRRTIAARLEISPSLVDHIVGYQQRRRPGS